MDQVDYVNGEQDHAAEEVESSPRPRQLPSDLPTSLDDRRAPASFDPGVEVYDAWQGRMLSSRSSECGC